VANFTKPLNFIRSTVSKAGKMYNSLPSQVAMKNSKFMAYAPKVGIAGAAVGAVGGGVMGGEDNRMSGAAKGMAMGALAGASRWRGVPRSLGSGSALARMR
jgi:hypothetical protein